MDCNWVNNRLLVGGIINKWEDAVILKNGGITHVINCMQNNDEEEMLKKLEVAYLHIGLGDDGNTKPVWWFKTALEWALPALAYPRNKLYVHCRGGVNRGPSVAYALLRAQGMKPQAAEASLRAVRPQIGLRYKDDANRAITALGYE